MGRVGAARGGEMSGLRRAPRRRGAAPEDGGRAPAEDAVREALERAQAWRTMARAFAPPRDLAALRDDLAALRSRARDALEEALATALGALAGERAEGLAAAYDALFGAGGSLPPRESAWADARVIAPAELADMRGFLRAFAMQENGELADHVATECEVASALAMKEAWALAQGWEERARVAREAYVALFRDHLLRWLPRLAACVQQARVAAFYAASARSLSLLLAAESARMGLPPIDGAAPAPAPRLDDDLVCGGCQTGVLSRGA